MNGVNLIKIVIWQLTLSPWGKFCPNNQCYKSLGLLSPRIHWSRQTKEAQQSECYDEQNGLSLPLTMNMKCKTKNFLE